MSDSQRQKAIDLFLEEYDFVRKSALRYAPRYELCDGIVNDVFVQFVSGAEQWNLEETVRPILAHLARTVAARHWKQQVRMAPESLRLIADKIRRAALARDDDEEDDRSVRRLRECIERLSPKARSLVEMFYWRKIPLYRIADTLNVKASTVRQTMVRIRLKLKNCIEEEKTSKPVEPDGD